MGKSVYLVMRYFVASSVAEWLGCPIFFFQSGTPNLKISGSIPYAITSANLNFHCCV